MHQKLQRRSQVDKASGTKKANKRLRIAVGYND
jgi:hypothetical protein